MADGEGAGTGGVGDEADGSTAPLSSSRRGENVEHWPVKKKSGTAQVSKRGRVAKSEWEIRVADAFRRRGEPGILEDSPLSRFPAVDKLAKEKYQNRAAPFGRALQDLLWECFEEIESELDDLGGTAKWKSFARLTLKGMGVKWASEESGITSQYTSGKLKPKLMKLLTGKLMIKLC
ncbi:hypothetical protein ACFLWB_02185 [Chloroflexota bacterium]